MIICTKGADTLLHKSFGNNEISISSINQIIEHMALDPTLSNPTRDAYIITSDDIRNPRIKQAFINGLQNKHPKSKVIFIDKASKPTLTTMDAPGLDGCLTKPKPRDVAQAISTIIANTVVDDVVQQGQTQEEFSIPRYAPAPAPAEPVQQADQEESPEELPPIYEPEPEPEPVVAQTQPEKESMILNRIKGTSSVADVAVLAREISSASLIKDLYETNATYAGIEEKLKSVNESIFLVMSDPTIPSLDDKLSKVRALLHDKAYFSSKGDTLIEQRLEEVIDVICSQTSSLLSERLAEIDTAITRVKTAKEIDAGNARLAGLNEERVNLILELRTLDLELASLYKTTDNIILSTVSKIANQAVDITGNEMLNAHLRARGNTIVSDNTVNAIKVSMDVTATKASDEFKAMQLKVVNMIKILSKIFDLDREIIAAQQATINFLKAKRIEDTVIAETLLKKSLRVFLAEEGTGRTILPYLLSYYKSRQNANVLLFDITGEGKYSQYGIMAMQPEEYLSSMNQQEFCLVSGEVSNSIASAQRIVTALTKAADYYRVINVVMRPDQKELFEVIASDVLCVNYITDMVPAHITNMAGIIKETRNENVAQRIILNKCDIPIRNVITKLGLDDQLDIQICVAPTISALVDANINGYNPYGISSVSLNLENVLKYA